MVRQDKLIEPILRGRSDANIPFGELCRLLNVLGFEKRIRGSRHIFVKSGVMEILNLQPKGAQARAYQVKQVRGVLLKHQLGGESD